MPRKPKGNWKANQFDWDRITTLSEEECCFSLTQQEIAIIYSYTEMIGWLRRWYSETGQEVDLSVITQFKNKLERKLMSGCCPDNDKIYRYTSEGIYESSDDDGITWVPDADNDPRREWVSAPPLPGEDGDSKKCAAADNVRDQFNVWADELIELLEAGTLITAIAAAVVAFIASVVFASGVGAAWGVLLFSFAAALFAEGSEGFDDAMTLTVYEQFRCILYCNIQEDGSFTEANIVAILQEITDTFDGIVEAFFYSIVSTMRSVGMSNTGTLGDATSTDCTECGCEELCATWEIANVGSAEASGAYLGTFDGYRRYESTLASSNTQVLTIMVDNEVDCCELIDFRVLTPPGEIFADYRINCEDALEAGNIQPGWTLESCVHYLSAQRFTGAGGTPFIVEFLFASCE
jgi:hypothetical protein